MRNGEGSISGAEKLDLLITGSSKDRDRAMTSIEMRTSRVGDIVRFQ